MYQEAKLHYEEQGFCFSPVVYEEESIARAIKHQDLVISGRYETGVAPRSPFDSAEATRGEIEKKIRPIAQILLSVSLCQIRILGSGPPRLSVRKRCKYGLCSCWSNPA